MKKFILLLALSASSAFGNLVEFQTNEAIKAQEINQNFNHIKTIIQSKNLQVNFHTFESGDLIEKEIFEAEFDKVRALGINVDPLGVMFIKAVEINTAFSQMAQGSVAVDDMPLSQNFSFTFDEDGNYSGVASFVNNDGTSSLIVTIPPQHGTVEILPNGNFKYTPNPNFTGTDSFSFKINDGKADSNVSVATVNVSPVNDAPVSYNSSLETPVNQVYSGTLNSFDIDGDPISYSVVSQGTKGNVALQTNGQYSFTPALNAVGADSFSFRVNDGKVFSNTATMSVNIATVKNCTINSQPGTQTWNASSNSWGNCIDLACGSVTSPQTAICDPQSKTKVYYP